MPKRSAQDARDTGALSRDERKNQHIMKLFEREKKLEQRREDKKKHAILSKNQGSSETSGRESKPVNERRSKPIIQQNKNGQSGRGKKLNHDDPVKIHVLFSNNVRYYNSTNRYFLERKQSIEEKQRQEIDEQWARIAHRHHLAQLALNQQNYANVANAGTGGHYEINDDLSGSSYLSSASKRQGLNDEMASQVGGVASLYIPNHQLMHSLSSQTPAIYRNGPGLLDPVQFNNFSLQKAYQNASINDQVDNGDLNGSGHGLGSGEGGEPISSMVDQAQLPSQSNSVDESSADRQAAFQRPAQKLQLQARESQTDQLNYKPKLNSNQSNQVTANFEGQQDADLIDSQSATQVQINVRIDMMKEPAEDPEEQIVSEKPASGQAESQHESYDRAEAERIIRLTKQIQHSFNHANNQRRQTDDALDFPNPS